MSWAFSVHPPGPSPGFGVRTAACPRPEAALQADTIRSLDGAGAGARSRFGQRRNAQEGKRCESNDEAEREVEYARAAP